MIAEVRTWFQPWYYKFGAIVLSAALGLCGYEWVNWSRLSASDWGTWVGAIGTVSTLIGTIWIANTETRRQNKQANDRAYVAAASLTTPLERNKSRLARALNLLQTNGGLYGSQDYDQFALELEQAGSWTDEDILPLIVLPDHCSVKMVVIRTQIAVLVRTMREMDASRRHGWTEESQQEEKKELIADLTKCHVSISSVLDAFTRFSIEMAAR